MTKSKQPLKGQKSIASFVFKQNKDGEQDQKPGSPLVAEEEKGNDNEEIDLTEEQQPQPEAKRQRQEQPPTIALPKPPPTIDATANEARHERWQRKLASDVERGPARQSAEDVIDSRGPIPAGVKLTPLETQVRQLQLANPGILLIIENGYKFKFYGRDAETAASVLGLFAYPEKHFLSCWVPPPRLPFHIRRLVQAGHKVGVVRQIETAAIKKASDNKNKTFDRQLTEIYTRATLDAGELAIHKSNVDANGDITTPDDVYGSEQASNYLVCVVEQQQNTANDNSTSKEEGNVDIGIVAVETSTGDVLYSEFNDGPLRNELESKLLYATPAELLIVTPISSSTRRMLDAFAGHSKGVRVEEVNGEEYKHGGALAAVTYFYGVAAQTTSDIDDTLNRALDNVLNLPRLVLRALAHSLEYLRPFNLESVLRNGAGFREYSAVAEMKLGPNTLQQLEILKNADDGTERGSLLWIMNRTLTASGSRLMRHWVSRPLRDRNAIEARLDAVEELLKQGADHPTLSALPSVLKSLPDLERGVTRALHKTSTPKEFLAVLHAFKDLHDRLHCITEPVLMEIDNDGPSAAASFAGRRAVVKGVESELLKKSIEDAANLTCAAVAKATLSVIDEDIAASGEKVGLFKDDDRFPEYAKRREDVALAVKALEELKPVLAKELNVKSIEYVSIQNQGDYLVEISPELASRVPKTWEKISTTKKAVRYHPPAVKQGLSSLGVAKEHLQIAATAAWKQLLGEFAQYHVHFSSAVRSLSQLDCLNAFGQLATNDGYVRPQFVDNNEPPQLHIVNGRHPVLDVVFSGGSFVPNDTHLGGDLGNERCAVITGPNMGGKSCYIRQTALIACMAQAGSFIPADSVTLRAFDSIFTRMGAADSISLGRSTFLEELSECSNILNEATESSLVVIDELGRGTATKDGTAIAEAVLEYLATSLGCLTLFVTHYLDVLPAVTKSVEPKGVSVKGYYMSYTTENDDDEDDNNKGPPKVVFLYKLSPGVAQASFGLNVARMAHLPMDVIFKANEKAEEFEDSANALRQSNAGEVGDGTMTREQVELELVARLIKALQEGNDVGKVQSEIRNVVV